MKPTLLLVTFSLHLSSADTHTLRFFYTGVTPGINVPEFTAVAQVDEEQSEYYDSNIREANPRTEWIKKINTDDPEFWKSETETWLVEGKWLEKDVKTLIRLFNQSKGVHTVQLMFGCELNDDNTTRGYSRFGYDGEDLISLDLKTKSWTADKHQAVITENKWKPEGHEANYCTHFVKHECIYWLKKFVSYGRNTLERKVRPEASVFQKHSPSPEVVCHATGFFPKALNISWQKDGKDLYEALELRETLPNQDGSFQKRTILKVSAEELQKHKYTCVIQHSSMEEDLVLPVSERRILRGGGSGGGSDGATISITVGVVVCLVAVVAIVSGIVVWWKKRSGFSPVSQNSTCSTMSDS